MMNISRRESLRAEGPLALLVKSFRDLNIRQWLICQLDLPG